MKTHEESLAELLAKAILATRSVAADQEPLTSGEANAPSVFDGDSLLQRLLGDRELACAVLAGFVQDAPFQLMQLHARLVEEDTAKIQLQAHNLKGSAATVGAEALRAIALSIETSAAASQLDPCRDLLPFAINEFERFKAQVEAEGWIAKTENIFHT
jgi:HPt (histidine-containing phosphotransfer) domain-containing protein